MTQLNNLLTSQCNIALSITHVPTALFCPCHYLIKSRAMYTICSAICNSWCKRPKFRYSFGEICSMPTEVHSKKSVTFGTYSHYIRFIVALTAGFNRDDALVTSDELLGRIRTRPCRFRYIFHRTDTSRISQFQTYAIFKRKQIKQQTIWTSRWTSSYGNESVMR